MRHVKASDDVPAEAVRAGTATTKQVLIDDKDGAPGFALRRFAIGPGGSMPLHTNTVEHVQYVLRGKARIRIGRERYEVKSGDAVFIQAGTPHSYETVGKETFEFLCVVPHGPDEVKRVEGC